MRNPLRVRLALALITADPLAGRASHVGAHQLALRGFWIPLVVGLAVAASYLVAAHRVMEQHALAVCHAPEHLGVPYKPMHAITFIAAFPVLSFVHT